MIRLKRNFTGRVLVTALVLVFGAASASAYTIVMRDGRRVEIPNDFTVTNSTLTYEISNGIQVTVQLNTVDVTATERANGEAAGSFLLKETAAKRAVESAPQVRLPARRSITNAELEEYRRTRIQNEQAYEKSRRELGLPSMEDRRREAAAIQERTLEQVRNMRKQQAMEQEAYWRSRVEVLRAQMQASGAQIGYDRPHVDDYSWAYPAGTFFPFDDFGFGNTGGSFRGFGRLPVSLFPGFLSTPITPFPSLSPRFRRPLLFTTPGTRVHPRPVHRRNR
jgi:hypothetical protein